MDDETVLETCAHECGADCCSGDIYVGETDAKRLRNAGHERFIASTESPQTMRTDEDGQCIFLGEDNRCTVYDDRPVDCRLFPLGINLVENRIEIVLVECPLSDLMTDELISELVCEVTSTITAYTLADLRAYDELAFSGEYTVLETLPIDQLQLADTEA